MPYKFREIRKRLIKLGYIVNRQTGSQVIFTKPGVDPIPVPNHGGKDISPGVEREILKKTGSSKDQFRNL